MRVFQKVKRTAKMYLIMKSVQFSSVQFLSHVWLCDPWTAAHQASLSITISWSLLIIMSIESVMPSSHLILCHPLLLPPSILPQIRVFSNELTLLIRWPKYWNFSFSISPSNEYSGLISFRIDWFELLTVQGNFKSLLQHYSSVQKHQFCAQSSLWSNSHICDWLLEKHLFLLYWLCQSLWQWEIRKPSSAIAINCGKFFKRWEYQTTWPASWETCMQVRKQQLELDMEQQTGSK